MSEEDLIRSALKEDYEAEKEEKDFLKEKLADPNQDYKKALENMDYNTFIKQSMAETGSFAGLDIHANQTFKKDFGGKKGWGRWLKKTAKDLSIADVPVLLTDYQQIAAQNIMLKEELNKLNRQLDEYNNKKSK
eukprot:TRINITY_DN4270_c2_g2_i1.p1 TRINITY_DN4270_c2_g2~~TRINITY_DN4270_c2_g2_i1.p1  ORF type:complete len:150 (-),score=58.00 TRINITY_DN4270_c2_g2_i1:306-707(-)